MVGNIITLLIALFVLLLFFAVIDLVMLFLLRKGFKWIAVIAAGVVTCLLIFFLYFSVVQNATGKSIGAEITAELDKNIEQIVVLERKNGASEEELEMLKSRINLFVVKTFPAWSMVSVLFLVFLNFMLVRFFAMKKYDTYDTLPSFENWFLIDKVMWLLIGSLGVVALKNQINNTTVFVAAVNVIFFLLNLYFLIGLAILSKFMNKRKIPKGIQFFIFLFIVLWAFLSVLLILAGILDTWINFRKITKGGVTWK